MKAFYPQVLVICLVTTAPHADASLAYSVTPLELRSGDLYGDALRMNDSGLVVGASSASAFEAQATVWDSTGARTSLPTLVNGRASVAYGINASGVAVGYSTTTSELGVQTNLRAVEWSGGVLTELPQLTGDTGYSIAASINDSGNIVGQSADQATLWTVNGAVSLGMGPHSSAIAINDSNQIAGYASSGAFIWESGSVTIIGNAPGTTAATAINRLGQVTGAIGQRAFVWSQGNLQLLGLLPESTINQNFGSLAYGINDLGEVVGQSGTHYFYWTLEAGMIDIQTMVPSDWKITDVRAINNFGWIAARGTNDVLGDRPLLLKPVPLPAAAWLLVSAFGGLGLLVRRTTS